MFIPLPRESDTMATDFSRIGARKGSGAQWLHLATVDQAATLAGLGVIIGQDATVDGLIAVPHNKSMDLCVHLH